MIVMFQKFQTLFLYSSLFRILLVVTMSYLEFEAQALRVRWIEKHSHRNQDTFTKKLDSQNLAIFLGQREIFQYFTFMNWLLSNICFKGFEMSMRNWLRFLIMCNPLFSLAQLKGFFPLWLETHGFGSWKQPLCKMQG